MSTLKINVKNVNVYPFFGETGPVGPAVLPVIQGAEGLYLVMSTMHETAYHLELIGGERKGKLELHAKYFAVGEYTSNSEHFQTPPMPCTNAGELPQFFVELLRAADITDAENLVPLEPPYLDLGPLTDVNVSRIGGPREPFIEPLIRDAKGEIIATRIGTPHLMGVEVIGGKRVNKLAKGMDRILVTGKTAKGENYVAYGLTCIDPNDPAIFLRLLA